MNTLNIYDKIETLIRHYEYYLYCHENASIDILLFDNSICFYLNDIDIQDQFILSFSKRERDVYCYLAVKIAIRLFSNVPICYNNYILDSSSELKKNIKISCLDEYIGKYLEYLYFIQKYTNIKDSLPPIKVLCKKANKRYSKKFINILDDRVYLSEKILRGEV